ncbi:MAG: hypothetical protein AAF394_05770 [Planctomycetota bacterium]
MAAGFQVAKQDSFSAGLLWTNLSVVLLAVLACEPQGSRRTTFQILALGQVRYGSFVWSIEEQGLRACLITPTSSALNTGVQSFDLGSTFGVKRVTCTSIATTALERITRVDIDPGGLLHREMMTTFALRESG